MQWICTYQAHLSNPEQPHEVYRCAFIHGGYESKVIFLVVLKRTNSEVFAHSSPKATHAVLLRRPKKSESLLFYAYNANVETKTLLTSALDLIKGPSKIVELVGPQIQKSPDDPTTTAFTVDLTDAERRGVRDICQVLTKEGEIANATNEESLILLSALRKIQNALGGK